LDNLKYKGAIVTMVERKSGYAFMAKVVNKTSDFVGSATVNKLKPLSARMKTLTYDNGKEFAGHGQIDEQLQSTAYFARPFASSWSEAAMKTSTGCCGNTSLRKDPCPRSLMRKLE
jgi:IS30 family transposase